MVRRPRHGFRMLVLLGALAARAGAQELAGTAILPESGAPVAGVIVEALDSAGVRRGAALTDARGRFRLVVPAQLPLVVRALRIGFAPSGGGSVRLAVGERREHGIVLTGAPLALPRVRVEGRTRCGAARDADRELAALLDEARKALQATRLSETAEPPVVVWTISHVYVNRRGRETGREPEQEHVGTVPRPFVSAPPEQLAARGYLQAVGTDSLFHAPDAEVLLSASFLAAHCFRAVPWPGGARDWVGVGFRPEAVSPGHVGIAGTLWLDRRTAALRFVAFEYVNVPAPFRARRLGGEVHFLRLEDGRWLVHEWRIRSPHFSERSSPGMGSTRVRRVVAGRQDYGGAIREIRQGDAVLYRRPDG